MTFVRTENDSGARRRAYYNIMFSLRRNACLRGARTNTLFIIFIIRSPSTQ